VSDLLIQVADGRTSFRPGESLSGTVAWRLEENVEFVELRLLWYTSGKGTQDVDVVDRRTFSTPPRNGQRPFTFNLPDGPYSFSGKLISLIWAMELVTPKGKESTRHEFVLSPQADEILLGSAEGKDA
jgi:hypothetical protein